MNKKLYKKQEQGLKGGPNYQVSEMFGAVTSTGYWPDSPDRNNDFNIIPSNQITMEGMDMDLIGQDDQGNIQYMTPGNNYTFPGNYVTETPVAKQGGMFLGNYTFKNGGLVKMDNGGPLPKAQVGSPYEIQPIPYRAPNIVRQEGREYYDPMTETIYLQPSYPNYAYEQAVKNHEKAHHQQKLKGKLSTTELWPGPLKEPAIGSTDDMIFPYYNRTTEDAYGLMNAVPKSTLFGIPEDVAVIGFQNKTYDTPGTAEYEAEQMIRKKKKGGSIYGLPKADKGMSTSGCDPGYVWDASLGRCIPVAQHKLFNEMQNRSWDPNDTYGYQQEPLNYNPKTGEYTNYKGQVVYVENKPMTIGSPKTAPKKSKAEIEKEKALKNDKKTKSDPTLWLQEHPEYTLDQNGNPILRSMLEKNDPEYLNKLDVQKAKEDFVKDLNKDPLQQSLGTASLDNPVTNQAAENYANYTVNNEDPRWATDKMLSGNDTPSTADFYKPHDATLGFGIPAAMVMAPIVVEAAVTGAPYLAGGWQGFRTAAKPVSDAWNVISNAPRFGSNALTINNAFKTLAAYDIAFKYGPRAVYDAEQYYNTGDTKHLENLGYNAGKSFLEIGSSAGPLMSEISAVKKPISLVDDARKTAQADNAADATKSGVKTAKNILGYLKKEGGGIYLGAYKKAGGQLVPHDISVPDLRRQDGGEMPFGLPLKEQNIYTLPEYNQPRNPMTGEILPDPQRPNLGMDTGATEYKYTYGFDDGDVDVPSIVAGQYIGDQAIDRYRLTGERFKTMADPGSYSKFYDQIGQLGLMQEKHGGSVKRVKIKSLPKNWKTK